MHTTLKYVFSDVDRHGRWRHYVRFRGRKVRLRAQPGTPEFLVAYSDAMKEIKQKK